jgi:hypothetical protein
MYIHTLKILHDDSPKNPWIDWDCEPPLFTQGNNGYWKFTYNFEWYTSPIRAILSTLSDNQLARKQKEFAKPPFGIDTTEKREWYTTGEFIRESITYLSDDVEYIQTLCELYNIPHLQWTSCGHSQSDWLECILVLTPEYIKKTGIKPKQYNDTLTASRKLFDAYIWWDVYGYQLTKHIPLTRPDGTLSTETEAHIVDSCWWFYGDDWLNEIKSNLLPEHQHLFDDAKNNIQY